ncbi:MAG: SdpI family protein [Actinobacteria bacterium]|nr:SdpI family protein [Actinomycetota bacterium]MCB9390518.1 SdpI family protein [Acidimicrobiia bacterium]
MTVIGFILAAAGALLIGMGLAMRAKRLKPNSFAGYRTKSSMASDTAWYAANAAVGPFVVLLGLLQVAVGVFFVVWDADGDTSLNAGVGIFVAACVVILGLSLIVGEKAARDTDNRS